jgi:hypothetical protein
MSSMYGSSFGYDSSTLERIARWALDLTLDFAPEVMLRALVSYLLNMFTFSITRSFLNILAVVYELCGMWSCL